MKKVWAPHLNRNVIIGGCKVPDRHAPMLKLGDYMRAGLLAALLPASPGAVDYSGPAMSVITNIEGNGEYGDCVEAEDAHFIAIMTGNAGTLYAYTPAQTLAAYTAITGFNASNPATDLGTDPLAALNYYVQNPYADGTKLVGYLQVDATNQQEVTFAINAFGNLKIWLSLPDSYINPFPSKNGFVWDVGTPDASNGHCIGACGYIASGAVPTSLQVLGVTALGVVIMSWGLIGTITWAALAALCVPNAGGGCAVRVTPDWLNKSIGKTPSGFLWNDLLSDFDTMGGTVPLPAPTPTAPATAPTCAQAQAAVIAAMAKQLPLVTRSTAGTVASAALATLWAPS